MSDPRMLLHQAQDHVGTAQVVLDEVGRGLATAERVEDAVERAVPVLRTVVVVALGCALGAGLVLVVRRARRRRRQAEGPEPQGSGPEAQL
jgi:hypothetical protein